MDFKKLLEKHLEKDKIATLIDDMKSNKIYITAEENIDTRYAKLKEQYDAKDKEHKEATTLIAELKKQTDGNAELQEKIGGYEAQIEALQTENAAHRLDSAIKLELLANGAKAGDIDYLMFKIKQNEVSVDDNGKVTGFDIEQLKTAHQSNFESADNLEVIINKPPNGGNGDKDGITKSDFDNMSYMQRLELQQNDPEIYSELSKQQKE